MFELSLARSEILTPLLTVAGAVDRKQSLAILSNILLQLKDNQLQLTATDLEIEITCRVPCHVSQGEGATTILAKKLVDIIRSLDEQSLPALCFDGDIVALREGRSTFKLATLPAAHYPSSEEESYDIELTLERASFIHLLQVTQFAMSAQDVRIFLNGLMLELDAQALTAVGSDGHRMALARLPLAGQHSHHRLLLPRKAVQEMLRLLNNIDDSHISISVGKSHFKLLSKQYTFLAKLIEARYPSYAKAIPRSHDKQITLDKDLLKRALARIVILANEKSRAILLHLQNGQLTLIANNHEKEEAIETIIAQTVGDELKIGINANYLMDVMAVLPEGLVRLSFADTNSSILVESLHDELYQYIIMPMKL